jgi:hypothetical protein
MTQIEILAELKKLALLERLQVVQAALRLIGEDLQAKPERILIDRKQQLAKAAKALLPDYAAGGELAVFTRLDSEEFYAQG